MSLPIARRKEHRLTRAFLDSPAGSPVHRSDSWHWTWMASISSIDIMYLAGLGSLRTAFWNVPWIALGSRRCEPRRSGQLGKQGAARLMEDDWKLARIPSKGMDYIFGLGPRSSSWLHWWLPRRYLLRRQWLRHLRLRRLRWIL